MHKKKHLSFTSLRKSLSKQIDGFPDGRLQGKLSYSQHDSLMSGFCMYESTLKSLSRVKTRSRKFGFSP